MARRAGPVRMCVGCRERAAKAVLLRVVADAGALLPDPSGRLPGRGASVHPDLRCLDLAERRRAFPRALRRTGPLASDAVRAYLIAADARADGTTDNVQGGLVPPATEGSGSRSQ